MIRCLTAGLRDRLNSFLGGVLYPEDLTDYRDSLSRDDELADLRDRCVNYEARLTRLTKRNAELLTENREKDKQLELLGLVNEDLRRLSVGLESERDRAVIDLREVLGVRTGSIHPSQWDEQ